MSDTKATTDLSERAWIALMNTGTNRRGAVVSVGPNSMVRAELREAGLIGPDNGLTQAGSIARERRVDQLLDELFPL